jgi:hypothetical protein
MGKIIEIVELNETTLLKEKLLGRDIETLSLMMKDNSEKLNIFIESMDICEDYDPDTNGIVYSFKYKNFSLLALLSKDGRGITAYRIFASDEIEIENNPIKTTNGSLKRAIEYLDIYECEVR